MTVLSIDWDFFVRESTGWGWNHNESPFMRDHIWPIRASGMIAAGLDIYDETDPEKHGKPTPRQFWKVLQSLGWDLRHTPIVVGDSHAVAGWAIHQICPEPDLIVNVDAHHDMGYQNTGPQMKKLAGSGELRCDTWLGTTARNSPHTRIKLCYPEWKGMWEWDDVEREPWIKDLKNEIKPFIFHEEAMTAGEDDHVELICIARSGAWSPPWLDAQFIEFVNEIESIASFGALNSYEKGVESTDPMQARVYSKKEVARMAEGMTALANGWAGPVSSSHFQEGRNREEAGLKAVRHNEEMLIGTLVE